MREPVIIFCDFDGTITADDTIEAFMQLFIERDIREIGYEMARQGYTVKRAISTMMSQIPVERYKEQTGFFDQLAVRDGFGQFLDHCHSVGVPVVIVSGGIEQMVERTIAPWREEVLAVYSAKVDLSGTHARIYSHYESETEMVSKPSIMKEFSYEKAICIGDSYTDLEMAALSDVVFARDRLAEYLDTSEVAYYPYDDFHDIIKQLKILLPTLK